MTKYKSLVSKRMYKRLVKYDLFKDISPSDLEAVLNCVGARFVTHARNSFIALDEDDMSKAGLILEGSVAMIKEDEHGHQSLILYMEEGDIFGESFSLARDHTSKVSFRTMTECSIMYLSVGKVLRVCRNNCPFHNRLITNLFDCTSRKNVSLMHKIDALSRPTIREKILTYLTEELESFNLKRGTPANRKITVPINRTEMAQYLCVNRSSLVRELTSMKRDGLLDINGNTFMLYPGNDQSQGR